MIASVLNAKLVCGIVVVSGEWKKTTLEPVISDVIRIVNLSVPLEEVIAGYRYAAYEFVLLLNTDTSVLLFGGNPEQENESQLPTVGLLFFIKHDVYVEYGTCEVVK